MKTFTENLIFHFLAAEIIVKSYLYSEKFKCDFFFKKNSFIYF